MANSRAIRNVETATHVAMIMDGNGRWATSRGMPRLVGHKRGVETVRDIVKSCPEFGVTHLTLYAFSTENWKRSKVEVSGLMLLLRRYINKEIVSLHENGVRLRFIGRRDRLDASLIRLMEGAEMRTALNDRLNLTIALDYGGRDEFTRATRRVVADVSAGVIAIDDVDEDLIATYLDTAGMPDPDLVIRTSGECRSSNFLIWQAAYSEYEFIDLNWPDFTPEVFAGVLSGFMARDRRFGAVAK